MSLSILDSCTLVERVSAALGARVWWLVDEHCVHGHDIGSRKALHILQYFRQRTVLHQDWVKLKDYR